MENIYFNQLMRVLTFHSFIHSPLITASGVCFRVCVLALKFSSHPIYTFFVAWLKFTCHVDSEFYYLLSINQLEICINEILLDFIRISQVCMLPHILKIATHPVFTFSH